MSDGFDPGTVQPFRVFDGGDLDCGSGLVLLIRENMLAVPVGGVLELRSRESTVAGDLPPWCRMAGHEFLGAVEAERCVRYFVRKGAAAVQDEKALASDKERARTYEWRLRARSTGSLRSTVYCRNFSFEVGQPASFEEKDRNPSAVEVLLGALAGDLATGFATECARSACEVDDIEISVRGRLENVLAHLGLEEGDPSFRTIEVKCFASTLDDNGKVRDAWERVVRRSPIASTLARALPLDVKLVFA